MEKTTAKNLTFDDFEIDAERRLLLKNGKTVALNAKAFDLLLVLASRRGEILSKNELLETVWENQFVEENNLTVHISALRKIFGEKKDEHRFIVTVPGKGYKFVAEVRQDANNSLVKDDGAADKKRNSNTFDADDRLIGRAAEIAEITGILRDSNKCLITLTGAGGSGKTKLARTIADELQTEFADGVFFIELASVNQPELVVGAIAQALEVKESSGKSLFETLKDFLRTRFVLLVLDNFEQLISAAHVLKELFNSASNLKILVTSRTTLHLKFEREKTVVPLAVPPPNSNLSAEELADYSAVELFAVRAQGARPHFALTEENIKVIAEICHKLDGLPLAIELAAARVKLLSPQAILARLEHSLNLLTGGAKDLPPRQRTMRGAIEWSYELLEPEEQKLFRRLAIFADGFTVEAAEFLSEPPAAVDGLTRQSESPAKISNDKIQPPATAGGSDSTLDILTDLIDNNLLVQIEKADGNVRLRMLEVVREFALECLELSGEREKLQRHHAEFFLALGEEAEPFLQSEQSVEWLEKLETEHDNFRAALLWALKNDGETAVRTAAALRYFWLNHSHLSEGLRWSQAALQVTENNLSEARSKLLLASGLFLRVRGEPEAAREIYEQVLTESRKLNDLPQMIKANHGLAGIAVLQKDFAAAQLFYEEALAFSRAANDQILTAHSLCALGDLELSKENLSAARSLLEECLTLSKKLIHKKLLTVTYFNLGTIDYFENKPSSAFNFNQTLQIAQELGDKTMISCALDGFAALAVGNGNAAQSAKLAGAADFLRETIGYAVEPAEEIFRENYLAKVRVALDEKNFSEAFEKGRAMTLSESVSLVEVFDSEVVSGFREGEGEIVIETHSFSRIIVEEIQE